MGWFEIYQEFSNYYYIFTIKNHWILLHIFLCSICAMFLLHSHRNCWYHQDLCTWVEKVLRPVKKHLFVAEIATIMIMCKLSWIGLIVFKQNELKVLVYKLQLAIIVKLKMFVLCIKNFWCQIRLFKMHWILHWKSSQHCVC